MNVVDRTAGESGLRAHTGPAVSCGDQEIPLQPVTMSAGVSNSTEPFGVTY